MAWVILDYLCCFRCPKRHDEVPDMEDERRYLIPPPPDDDMFEDALLHQRRLDEQLGGIIRSKGGKMVNVTSHLPFNLHNRALPDDSLANSRSGSRSVDLHHAQGYEDDRLRPRRWSSQERYRTEPRSRPPSVYDRQRPYSRPSSPESVYRDTIRREPILNLRLVGYVPPSTRGRSMSKNSDTAKKESPGPEISRSINSSAGTPPQEPHQLQLQGVDLICTSWGD
ncbi:hypothetical protein F5887DRAFT_1077772 [Amanita rubescens]|nr:hypothetical protein F5887DRAFT_1079450 [Amanita rubescens]KAF8338431.1 hypothetical protein F5887DRAFT_1077772 [Amanita rubescens]